MVLAYLLVLSIFIIFSFITTKYKIDNLENDLVNLSMASVTQSQKVIDMYFSNIFDSQGKLANDIKVNEYSLIEEAFSGINGYKVIDLMNYLRKKNLPYEYYIFYKKSSVVIGTNTVYSYDDFYKFAFHYKNYSADQFWDFIFKKKYAKEIIPCANTYYNDQEQKNILFLHSVGYNFLNPDVVIVYIVKNSTLTQLMGDYKPKSSTNFLITDKNNTVISSLFELNNADLINRDDFFITSIPSEVKSFDYILLQPVSVVFKHSNATVRLFLIFSAAAIIIMCSVFAVVLFYNKNIYKIFEKNTRTLNEQLKKQIPHLREDFFRKLLEGKFSSQTDLKVYSSYINFNLEVGNFQLMLIKISPSTPLEFTEETIKSINIYSLHLQNLISANSKEDIIHILSYDRIIVIAKSRIEGLLDLIENMQSSLPCNLKNLKLSIGIGNNYDSINEIPSSYSEAQCALIYSMVKNNSFYSFYSDIRSSNNAYYFPIELNSLLINHTCAGNIPETERILGKLITENILNRNLSIDMIKLFLNELFSTVIKIRNNINIEEEAKELRDIDKALSKYSSLDDIQKINACISLLKKMCNSVNIKRCRYKENLSSSIKTYVEQNYQNSDLSLNLIACKFNISETYASQLFKEYTKETYTKYLQNLRLKRANILLKTTDIPIKTILHRIGYNSLNTFERAYKRIYGKTPSQYRKSL